MKKACCGWHLLPFPPTLLSFRNRLSYTQRNCQSHGPTSLIKKLACDTGWPIRVIPGNFDGTIREALLSLVSLAVKRILEDIRYYQVEKVKTTPRNTELRDGRNVFLIMSFETLDSATPEDHQWSFPLRSIPEFNTFSFSLVWIKLLNFCHLHQCFLPPPPR